MDEFWSFLFKKEKNLTAKEKQAQEKGDFWTFTAVNPTTKLIFAHIFGKRITENAIKLLKLIKLRVATVILFITTDAADMYLDAISSTYGKYDPELQTMVYPTGFCYAQVVKKIEKNRCTEVSKKIIIGHENRVQLHIEKSMVSYTINTAFVERANLTLRQHNHRVERKSQGYSKENQYYKHQMNLSIAYYNFCLAHSSLSRYNKNNTLIPFTPAMEANLTHHQWSLNDLLSFLPP